MSVFLDNGREENVVKRRKKKNLSCENRFFFHIAEVNDVIIQPSFTAQAVITESKFDDNDSKIWALVAVFEAIGKEFHNGRGLKLVYFFAKGIEKGVFHDLAYLVRLLKIKDYRNKFVTRIRICQLQ